VRVEEKHVNFGETDVDSWYKAWLGDTDEVDEFRRWVAGLSPDVPANRKAVAERRANPYVERVLWLRFDAYNEQIWNAGLRVWDEMKAKVREKGWEVVGEALHAPQDMSILTPVLAGRAMCKATARRKKTPAEVYEMGPAMVPGWTESESVAREGD
jgi:hypothetical protein